jgi:hypothetical protein
MYSVTVSFVRVHLNVDILTNIKGMFHYKTTSVYSEAVAHSELPGVILVCSFDLYN